MVRRVSLTKQVSVDELKAGYKREEDARVKERLLAILHLYEGRTIGHVSKIIKRSERSIGRWVRAWNESGYDGLVPQFDGGPKPRIDSDGWDHIIKEIDGKGMTIRDVKVYVKTSRGVEYAYKTVWEILRKEKKVRYGKPYIRNKKRPANAEEILKKGSATISPRR